MLNTTMLMGRLTADPEIKTAGESRFCKFCLAVDRSKRRGEGKPDTDFIHCIAWNRNADVVNDFYRKGDLMMLMGSLRTSAYEKNGEQRTSTEIVVREIHFTNSRKPTAPDTSGMMF